MEVGAELLGRLIDSAPEGIVVVDALLADMPVVYSNLAFQSLTGYAAGELRGRNLRFLQGEDRDQDGRQRLREALARREPCRLLLRNYRKDGSLFWNDMTIQPLPGADGQVAHFVGHHRDAGERLRIDPRLQRDSLSGAHQPTSMTIRDDRLTGLYTVPYLEELMKRDWAIAQRERRSIALFAMDVDALDLYNATFGRAAGDSAIRRVAHCLSGCLRRAGDAAARGEGGSFIAMAPGLDADEAMRLGGQIAGKVRELRIHHPRSTVLRYVSVSVGVAACVPEHVDGPAVLVQQAGQQLQAAKRGGGNQAA
jgi:diguanylate cyclase (GGDEF)-like protein/PAS domain S-box-containing protein